MKKDLYEILEVSRTASLETIKAAYKSLAQRYHPDKNPGNNEFEELFKSINFAYDILSDPEKRIIYDSGLKASLDHEQQSSGFERQKHNYQQAKRAAQKYSLNYGFYVLTKTIVWWLPVWALVTIVFAVNIYPLVAIGSAIHYILQFFAQSTWDSYDKSEQDQYGESGVENKIFNFDLPDELRKRYIKPSAYKVAVFFIVYVAVILIFTVFWH